MWAVRLDATDALLPSLEKSIPTAVFAISDPQGHDLVDAKVLAQGRVIAERANGRAVALNPGVYTLEIAADGFVTVRALGDARV